MDEKPSKVEITTPLITRVGLYSVWGLCEPDLTGSCHVLTITYETGEKIGIILDAGSFQKKSSAERNKIFDQIFRDKGIKIVWIFKTHDHFDHIGRIVALHKVLREYHALEKLPIIQSPASRDLFPHVLASFHNTQGEAVRSFDEATNKMLWAFDNFARVYTQKPEENKKSRGTHQPHGDVMRERETAKKKRQNDLLEEFQSNGGIIKKWWALEIPPAYRWKGISFLKWIMQALKELKNDTSDRLSTEEWTAFNKIKEPLCRLQLGEDLENHFFATLLDTYIPRQDRAWREKKIKEVTDWIKTQTEEKRKTFLPEITADDLQKAVSDSVWIALWKPYSLPWVPNITATLRSTGHMLGAVSVEFTFTMINKEIKRLLMTGDIGSWEKPTIHGIPHMPQEKSDIVIMETTNASRIHPNVPEEIEKMMEFIKGREAPILMPVFSLDRMHVVLDALKEEILNGKFPCPIYWRNPLGQNTLQTYLKYYPELAPIFQKITELSGDKGGQRAHNIMRWNQHCVMIASGGCLVHDSTARNLLNTRAESGNEIHIIFTGFQPGELGKRIMESVKAWTNPKEILQVANYPVLIEIERGNISNNAMFSGHADDKDLIKVAQGGKKVMLIHGQEDTATDFSNRIWWAEIVRKNTPYALFTHK